jgi:hypothetical protein
MDRRMRRGRATSAMRIGGIAPMSIHPARAGMEKRHVFVFVGFSQLFMLPGTQP